MGMATNTTSHDVSRRLDAIGWGLLFLMTGTMGLISGLPDGTWLIGLGVLLLGLNVARWMAGMAPAWFMVILGAVALVAGLGGVVGVAVPWFALLLILCGIAVIAGQVARGGRAA